MKLSRERANADAAAARLHTQRKQLSDCLQAIQSRIEPWRPSILVGGGLLGGYLLGQRQVARLASGLTSLASAGFALMRTPLGHAAVAMLNGARDRAAPAGRQDSSQER